MTEALILQEYELSTQNAKSRCLAVNALRHLMMDPVVFDSKNDSDYMSVYLKVMGDISSRYPLLSWEVQRQVAKKKRRQERKVANGSQEQRAEPMHFRA
jgi:hypothetical protein